ncbi:hypothetical protein FBU30_009467 [Linnemannia zychae]|nr:hypothetical protein FBU30_009467 [Linnemannia zychae]
MLQLQQQQQQQQGDRSYDGESTSAARYTAGGSGIVIMQDWLHKRSSSLQLVWKRRWCVLHEDRVYFYRSNTDTKPLGMLHLSEYNILSAGPEVSRKSKLAFRLSSPEPIPHQQQHHLFFTESAQALQNWLYSLQHHINHTTAIWSSKTATSTAAGLGLYQAVGGSSNSELSKRMDEGGIAPGQSIIDKVLNRLCLEDSATSGTGLITDASPSTTTTSDQPRQPYIPPNFPKSHEDNNDTWSSASSMPFTSTNTSANLEYIFTLNQQNQAARSSMDSLHDSRNGNSDQGVNTSPATSGVIHHQPILSTPISFTTNSTGYAGSTFTDQSSATSEVARLSIQSADHQGRSSLHQSRPSPSGVVGVVGSGSSLIAGSPSPSIYPTRSSVHSGLSAENGTGSPATSIVESPYASPILASQHPSLLSSNSINSNSSGNNNNNNSNNNNHNRAGSGESPRAFYRVLETSSPSKRAESIASSASISTIASSGDISTINDLNSENGLSSTATDSSLPSKSKSAGATILGLVTGGGKNKKDKKDGGGSSSSTGLKLFGSGVCHYSGCTQMAKTCTFHNKKFRPESPSVIASRKAKEEKKAAKELVKEEKRAAGHGKSPLWSSSSDKNGIQGCITEISSPIVMKATGPLSININNNGRNISSKSMVTLPRDAEFGIDPSMVPLPSPHFYKQSLSTSPTRRRSPSVSVLEDSLSIQQQSQSDHIKSLEITTAFGGYSMRPQTPLSAAPSQPLPLPPVRAPSAASNTRPGENIKETFSLSRKMGLQMGSEFGAVDKGGSSGTSADGNYFIANHHRAMQKFQLAKKPQPQQQQPSDQQQQQQQQQQRQYQQQQQQSEALKTAGVSRHIVAPDELAMAIEMEAEEMKRRQTEAQEAQKSRPTSIVRGSGMGPYYSAPIQVHLATVSESTAPSDYTDDLEPTVSQDKNLLPIYGGKIISTQEQLAYAPMYPSLRSESARSPISEFIAEDSPLSPSPRFQLPFASPAVSLNDSGNSIKTNNYGSPRSNSFSGGSSQSSSVFSPGAAPLQSSPFYNRQITSSPGPGSRHPMSPVNSSFREEDRSEFPMRSLPPPKRHGNDHSQFKGNNNGVPYRGGLPRRSSAAAAVTLSPEEINPSVSSQGPSTSPTTGYMARRQSSSPVLIRVSDQGGQNISPLLSGDAIKTFAGNAPSRDVARRPSELTTPVSSADGSPVSLTSSGSSLSSPTVAIRGKMFRTASSPLSSVTPADGCTPSASPTLESSPRMSSGNIIGSQKTSTSASSSPVLGSPYNFPAMTSESVPSVAVDDPHTLSSDIQAPPTQVQYNTSSFRFPAPSVPKVDSNDQSQSVCSSSSSYSSASENFSEQEEEEDYHTPMDDRCKSRQSQQQQRDSNTPYRDGTSSPSGGMSSSLHAAVLGLYPGLRKLSLFTAAVGDYPPPPLLDSRKSSAGSTTSTRDYHHGITSPTLSTMEDGDEATDEEEFDLHNDEDWAGNMKSMRKEQPPVPTMATTAATPDHVSSATIIVNSDKVDGLSAPPSIPLPLTPPPSIPQPHPPRLVPSGIKSPIATTIPEGYSFPASPTTPLPMTPPVSGNITVPASPQVPKNLTLAEVTVVGVPPVIPPRSPHRSAPGSPTTLRSMRSYQSLTANPPAPPSGA